MTVTELAVELAGVALACHRQEHEITLLGVSVSNLVDQASLQLELPLGSGNERHRPGTPRGNARLAADCSVDAIRARFGNGAVGYAAVVLSPESRVPEEFRQLAEHEGLR